MASTPTHLLAVPSDSIIGGVIRAWVDGSGEITVVNTARMGTVARLKVAAALMRHAENEGFSPKGVAFV